MGRRDRFVTAMPLLRHCHYSSFFTQLCWLTALALTSFAGKTATAAATWACSDVERDALLAFKSEVSDPSNRLSSWDSSQQKDCCRWSGIVCRNASAAARSYVVWLNLANPVHRNRGTTTALRGGMLPPSLLYLTHLELLDLSFNNFGGAVIPEFIGSFRKLRHLDLGSSNLGGTIPPQLGNLSSLRYLDLSGSGASLRAQSLDWLTRLSSLAYLDISSVNLRAVSHNWLSAVSMIPSLQVLSLSDCRLHRQTPFSSTLFHLNLTSLAALDLSNNNFYSTIPSWLWQLTALSSLNLSSTNVHGAIPVQIGKLFNIQFLSLSSNYLFGHVSQLHFANLTSLLHLDLSGNSNLYVAADQNWLPLQLQKLHLGSCTVGPNFPRWLRSQRAISSLDMSDSGIEDAMPGWFWNSSTLEFLNLSQNRITGTLGMIDSFAGLNSLDLSRNYFRGEIPNTIGRIKSLKILDLSFNNISGDIPPGLLELNFLYRLNLSYNNLSGTTYRFARETLNDDSIYVGNIYLCVPGSCLVDQINNAIVDEKHEKFSRMLSFCVGLTLGIVWALWILLLLSFCLRKHERNSSLSR